MMEIQRYQAVLKQAGVIFQAGLTTQEVSQIEARFNFSFPPDYCAFLMHGLPTSRGFVDWRNETSARIQEMLLWPYEGMCFDIEHNGFWLRAWGQRPEQFETAFAIAKDAIEKAPTLIPINGHRYIPATPAEEGNPIFSVYQTDIICYGRDLSEYIGNEFGYYFFGAGRYQVTEPIKPIPFWSYLVDVNNAVVDDGTA